jgi:hypothetical protein
VIGICSSIDLVLGSAIGSQMIYLGASTFSFKQVLTLKRINDPTLFLGFLLLISLLID